MQISEYHVATTQQFSNRYWLYLANSRKLKSSKSKNSKYHISKKFVNTNGGLYHYAANNPVRYVDPDGRENKAALEFMKNHIVGKWSGYGYSPNPDNSRDTWTPFKMGAENLPDNLLCYEAVWASYRNSGTTKDMPASRANAYAWFKKGGTTQVNGKSVSKKLELSILNGQTGDVVFMGEFFDMNGHSVLLDNIKVIDDNKIELNTVGAFSPNGKVGPETMAFEKNDKGEWINTSHGNYKYIFRGYGQYDTKN